MSEEKPAPGSPNWLFGLDKLTTPALDYVGLKLRDKLRAYLNQKARERVMLRHFEKDFLYRQIDLMNYGADQYAVYLETMGDLIIKRHFQSLSPLIRFAVTSSNISPQKAFECVTAGFTRENVELAGGELILFTAASGVLDILLTIQAAKLVFQFANVPSSVHIQNPTVTDEQIEELLQDEATIAAINDGMISSDLGAIKLFAKTLTEIYGFEWDEEKFEAHQTATDQANLTENKDVIPR